MASTAKSRDEVESLVLPVVQSFGMDLEGLTVKLAGQTRRVSVLVDKDGGVGIDECAEVSRAVSSALDTARGIGETAYTLEVGSPGATRPLTEVRHWRRAIGRLVKVTDTSGSTVVGRLTDLEVAPSGGDGPDGVSARLDVDGAETVLSLADVRKARVELEFKPMSS